MQMVGRNASTGDYRYGFQGQESDNEITGSESHIGWTYRCNDVRLGRFLSLDPLAPDYPMYSPYHFSSNQPIHAGEFEGLESKYDISPTYLHYLYMTGQRPASKPGGSPGQIGQGGIFGSASYRLFEANMNNYGRYIMPGVDVAIRYNNGEHISTGEWVLEIIGVVPVGKFFGLGGKVAVKVGDKVYDASSMLRKAFELGCFVAGTEVKTSEGHKPIEEIEVGELAWAYNEQAKELELREVTAVFIEEAETLVKIVTAGQEIVTTPNHPFYSEGVWKVASELKVGDELFSSSGAVEIISIEVLHDQNVQVYNFTVDEFHNYLVSKDDVLVHNQCALPKFTVAQANFLGATLANAVSNSKLTNIVKGLWKPLKEGAEVVGNGSAIHARYDEIISGVSATGTWHGNKLLEAKNGLQKLINGVSPITGPGAKTGKNKAYHVLNEDDMRVAKELLRKVEEVIAMPNPHNVPL
jgi:RHS repeat-associated protein